MDWSGKPLSFRPPAVIRVRSKDGNISHPKNRIIYCVSLATLLRRGVSIIINTSNTSESSFSLEEAKDQRRC